jgi:hypothetical protein
LTLPKNRKSAEQLLREKQLAEAAGVLPGEPFAVHPKSGHVFVKRGDAIYVLTERGDRRIGTIRNGALELAVSYPLAVIEKAEEFGFTKLRLRAFALDRIVRLEDIERSQHCAATSNLERQNDDYAGTSKTRVS